ncbi:TEA-domain-containing protein [Hesseltinella vesiculosa]|uniref:TEA-domain-containing protein n=1 Tax=Hesseltinella vesiculosa TaxID=101127 RepID=A0A1X2G8T3_9FUNG|nr:TEA-domain-containing protein [Hesseltinella vesiculosa]
MLACTQDLFFKPDSSLPRDSAFNEPVSSSDSIPFLFEARDDRTKLSKRPHNLPPQSDKDKEEQVWPPEVESAFIEALETIPKLGRRKILVNGKPCGRNELISDFIFRKTSKIRTRKQVSSHIQVLKNTRKGDPQFMRLLTDTVDMDDEVTQQRKPKPMGNAGHSHRKRHQQHPPSLSHPAMQQGMVAHLNARHPPTSGFVNPTSMAKLTTLPSNTSLSSDESSITSSPSPADYVFDMMYGAGGDHSTSYASHHISLLDIKDPFYDTMAPPLLDMETATSSQLTTNVSSSSSSSSSSSASSHPSHSQQHGLMMAMDHPHESHYPSMTCHPTESQPPSLTELTASFMSDTTSWLTSCAGGSMAHGTKMTTGSNLFFSSSSPSSSHDMDSLMLPVTDMYGLPSTPGLTTPVHERAPELKPVTSSASSSTSSLNLMVHGQPMHSVAGNNMTPPMPTSQKWKRGAKRKSTKLRSSRKANHIPADLLTPHHPPVPMTPIPHPPQDVALWPNYICLYLEFPTPYTPSALSSHTLAQLPHCLPSSLPPSDHALAKYTSLLDSHPVLSTLSMDAILLANMKLDLNFSMNDFFFNNTCFFESRDRRMIECTMTIYSFGNVVLESKEVQQALWINEGKYMYSFVYVNHFFDAFMKGVRTLQSWDEVDIAIHNLCIAQVFEEIDAPADAKDPSSHANAKRTPLLAMIYEFERGQGTMDIVTMKNASIMK